MIRVRSLSVCLFVALLCLGVVGSAMAATHDVGPTTPLVLPIAEVIGGTDAGNNFKNNPNGGYLSTLNNISEFTYPASHGNQFGNTAMVNDHTYWDSSPGGLDYTHAPHPDAGGGAALWWPTLTEWLSYDINVTADGSYTVLYRFSSAWGPSGDVNIHMTIDGVSSGSVTIKPDDASIWADPGQYQVAGWWGHTMVSGTVPSGWALTAGHHVLKIFIDSWPGSAPGPSTPDHGTIWFHYFKVMAGGNAVTPPDAVATPTITPNGGVFTAAQSVTLADATAGAAIRYTLDGSTPTATSTLYAAPFTISTLGTTVVNAIAFTATAQSTMASASFVIDQVPTVARAALATPNPVTGTTTQLSVLGADNGGEPALIYTWTTTGTPPATVAFSANGSNGAKITTATFSAAGAYSFQVTITDAHALTVTSTVAVTVNTTPSGITVTPPNAWLEQGAALAFSATAVDQFAHAIAGTPAVTWSATGGTITSNGLFTAGGTAGTFAVTASGAGGAHGDATVTVTAGFAATINFAPVQSSPFGNALSDSGLPFADRGNGKSYGWDQDLSGWTRERASKGLPSADLAHDTLVYMQRGGSNAVFELVVPNGLYLVRLVCGDSEYTNSVYRLAAEGVLVVDGVPDATHRWVEGTQTVTVSDGRLTVTCAPGAVNAKLCLIEVTVAPAAPAAPN